MSLDIQTSMHLMILELIPLPDKREALLEILLSVRKRTQVKSGCLNCAVYAGCGGKNTILYLEQWSSKSELLQHIQSNLYRQILIAMELAGEAPEIHFYEVLDSAGMELIENQRVVPADANA